MTSKLQDAIDKLLRELKETADESGIDGTTVLRQAEAINRLKEQLTAARQREEEAKEEISRLRELIATGHSRGAAISPFVRDVFSAGSKAAAERDALTQERDALRAENDRLTLAAIVSARTLQVEIASLRERLQWIRALASGYDADGALGPRAPLSWESVARMAMDYADVSRLPQDGA